jgi:hypothetical protein
MRESLKRNGVAGWLQTSLLISGVFLLNLWICHELFGIEYLSFMASIEGVFIGLGRHILAHWNDLTWFPLWTDGVPYQTAYPPLLPLLVALRAWAGGISAAHAFHWVTALLYCLGPVALFALVLRLSRSRWTAFAAGVIYSSVSMSAWLVPGIARDLGGAFFPRRLQALVFYGEAPHICSITFLTLALLCLDLAMTRRSAPYTFLAALAFAATALTNWLGAFATVLVVLPYTLAHLGPGGWKWRDFARLGFIGVAAYGLAMPLMPPSTIAVLALNARTTGGDYVQASRTLLTECVIVLAALGAIKAAVRRWTPALQFSILFAFLMSVVTLADDWWGIAILPMSARYHLEMEMALSMLAALVGLALLRDRPRWMGGLTFALLLLALIQPIRMDRRYARDFLLRTIDIQKTIEWKKAQWLNQHWGDDRVLIAGSTAFWLAAFSDTPQLWGVDQGTTDFTIRVAEYAIFNSGVTGVNNAANSVLWLKALGVQAVGVSGPASQEAYKNFQDPKVFEGVLDPIWREGDDVIYRVGAGHTSLARIIPTTAVVSREPIHGLDVDPIRPYVAALDDPALPRAAFHWTSMHSADIAANLQPNQLVSVQIAWAPGWHAIVNGRRVPVQRDAIGLMYIDPGLTGPCNMQVIYDGGTEKLVARGVSLVTALLLALVSVLGVMRREAPYRASA